MKRKEKKESSKAKAVFEAAVGYVMSILLAFVFALYCSWRIGFFLVLAFIFAPVLSLLLTFIFLKCVTIESELSKSFVGKKEKFYLEVTLRNRFFLPTPGILLETYKSPNVTYERESYQLNLMPFSETTLQIPVTATICCASKVGISNFALRDYLDLITFSVNKKDAVLSNRLLHTLAVVPDITEISGDEDFIRQTYTLSTTNGESNETVETTTNVMGGFPGYDHREYVPGDPLKRINWKLSAKREKLYVRLDDEVSSSTVQLILDPVSHITQTDIDHLPPNLYAQASDYELPAMIRQNAVETALGIAVTLLSRNLSVTFLYNNKGHWETYPLANFAQVTQLQQNLASFAFEEECLSRFPFTDVPETGAAFFCTSCRYNEIPFREVMVYSSLDGKGRKL